MRWFWIGMVATACTRNRPAEVPTNLSPLHMANVVDAANAARLAVIAGDAPTAQAQLGWLSDAGFAPRDVPAGLRSHAERLVSDAQAGAATGELGALARAVANVGRACGACHTEAGVGPEFAKAVVPAGNDVRAHMARHQWGSDSLWEGLVTPHEGLWAAGANAFYDVPVDPEVDPRIPAAFTPLTERIHDIGTRCSAVFAPADRAARYAELIETCGECHRALGGPPGSTP